MPASYALQTFIDVADHFKVLLQKASSVLNGKGRLLIFLDSIDQLSTEDGAHRYMSQWLALCTITLALISYTLYVYILSL